MIYFSSFCFVPPTKETKVRDFYLMTQNFILVLKRKLSSVS